MRGPAPATDWDYILRSVNPSDTTLATYDCWDKSRYSSTIWSTLKVEYLWCHGPTNTIFITSRHWQQYSWRMKWHASLRLATGWSWTKQCIWRCVMGMTLQDDMITTMPRLARWHVKQCQIYKDGSDPVPGPTIYNYSMKSVESNRALSMSVISDRLEFK